MNMSVMILDDKRIRDMHRIHHRATYNHYFIGWELSPKLICSTLLSASLWRLVESTVKWQLTPKNRLRVSSFNLPLLHNLVQFAARVRAPNIR